MPSWTLDDAAEIAAQNPYTFYRPSAALLAAVAVGDLVKLIFRFDSDRADAPAAERMWVMVRSVDGEGGFTGVLDNDPFYIEDLKAGDPVAFRDSHIINTQRSDPDDPTAKYAPRCFVTRRVLYDGARAGYLYREAPEYDDDSGWRITAGDESDEYMDDADNCAYVSLGAVLSRDDAFVTLLDAEVGAAFARDEDRFVRLPDRTMPPEE